MLPRALIVLLCTGAALGAQQTRARVGLPGFQDMFRIEDVTQPFELKGPVGKSYSAIRAALAELKVPVEVDDSIAGILGTLKTSARTSFAGFRLSRLFDCGGTSMGGQNADTFRLTIAFVVLFDSVDASHTKLGIGAVAGGEPLAGARRDAVQCGSTGVLEARLVELAVKHLN